MVNTIRPRTVPMVRRSIVAGLPVITSAGVLIAACGPTLTGEGVAGDRRGSADLAKLQQKVQLWGPSGAAEIPARQAQADVWNRKYPNLPVEVSVSPFTSAQGIEGLQKLFAAVAAGDPPDVVWIDRFQLSNLAVRKTVASLDNQIKRDKYELKQHFAPLLEETTGIDGKTYGLPSSTDNRALWWNKRALREAGLDAEKGPKTWDELRSFAVRATRPAPDGGIDRLGWNYKSPGFGILYLWSWLAGAQFFSKDGRTAQYNHPGVTDALNFLLAGADAQGGTERVDAFLADAGRVGDPFTGDRVLMQLNSPLSNITRTRPDMEFGWGPVPVKKSGDKIQTFAGGFAWAVPTGTKNPDVAWGLLRTLMSEEALVAWAEHQAGIARGSGGTYIPGFTTVQAVDKQLRQKFATKQPAIDAAWDFNIDLMQYAKVRPVSPAAAEAWDALGVVWNNVLARKQTPKEACDAMNVRVQKALDEAYASAGARK
jgi:multiple sugar transport system substrate-binding protein